MGLPVGEAAALGAGGSGSAQLAGVVAGQALQGGPIVVVAILAQAQPRVVAASGVMAGEAEGGVGAGEAGVVAGLALRLLPACLVVAQVAFTEKRGVGVSAVVVGVVAGEAGVLVLAGLAPVVAGRASGSGPIVEVPG